VTIGAFVLVALAGACVAYLVRAGTSVGGIVGIGALAIALVAALAIVPGSVQPVGGIGMAATAYLRIVVVTACLAFLVLAVQDVAGDGGTKAMGTTYLVTLAALGAGISVLGAGTPDTPDVPAAVGPALGVVLAGAAALILAPPGLSGRGGLPDATVLRTASRQLRLIGLATALAVVGMAWLAGRAGIIVTEPVAVGSALLLVAAAVAARMGALPFHGLTARLVSAGPLPPIVAVTAWLPAAFALAAAAWSSTTFGPFGEQAPSEARALIVLLAVLTLAVGTTAASLADGIPRAVAYAIVADGGFALLALATVGPDAAAAARTWLVCNALAKTALVAWAIAMDGSTGTTRLADLRGWARRAPVLGGALAVVAAATYGLPGWPAFDSRAVLIRDSGGGLLQSLALVAAWVGVAIYARILVLGLLPAESAAGARLRLPVLAQADEATARRRFSATGARARAAWRVNAGSVVVGAAMFASLLAAGISAGVGGLGAAARDAVLFRPDAGASPSPSPGVPGASASPAASPARAPAASRPPGSPRGSTPPSPARAPVSPGVEPVARLPTG